MKLFTEHSPWLILLCLAAGAVYSALLYLRNRRLKELSSTMLVSLAVLRFLLVSVIAFFLLEPFWQQISRRTEKAVIIFAHDNSESIVLAADSAFNRNELPERFKQVKNQLSKEFQVVSYTFGEQVKREAPLTYTDNVTDLQELFNEVENRYSNRNVGAMVIASDGVINKGSNPVFSEKSFPFPVYTVALGDPVIHKDLMLLKVYHNRIAYLGNSFPMEIVVNAYKCRSCPLAVTVTHAGKTIFSRTVIASTETFSVTVPVQLTATSPGTQKYTVSVSAVQGEQNVLNNTQDVFIDVIDSRQKILLLAQSPHPDINAIKLALEKSNTYELSIQLASDYKGDARSYSMIILHQVPSQQGSLVNEITNSGVPIFYILGTQSNLNVLSQLQLPVQISNSAGRANEAEPYVNKTFDLFALDEATLSLLNQVPPLVAPFGNYKLANNASVLLKQKIGVVESDYPLLVFGTMAGGDKKSAVLAGENIWKWRLHDYLKNRSHDVFDGFINKVIQFLAVRADRAMFRIFSEKLYSETQAVEITAELYNASYELVNAPDVQLTLFNEQGKRFNYTFDKTHNSYRLDLGQLPAGVYRYTGTVKAGANTYSAQGQFTVSAVKVESLSTTADHRLLQQIAEKQQGEMLYPRELQKLANLINNREDITAVQYSDETVDPLINLKVMFFLLPGLLAAEWFIRKRNGSY